MKQFVLNKMLLIKLLNFNQINAALMSIRYFFIYLYKFVIKGVIRCDFEFSFLKSVISRLCIDNIPDVTKTKVSKPKRYSLSKQRLPKTAHSNTPPRLRHCVGRFSKHHPNVNTMKEGGAIILAVVLLLPPAPCRGDVVLGSSRRDTASQYGEGRNISVSRLRYSANPRFSERWVL